MAAIVVGLLAMHSSGAEHAVVAQLPAATAPAAHTAQTAHTGHAEVPLAEVPLAGGPLAGAAIAVATTAATTFVSAAASAVQCDDACLHGVLDCALMVMTCAMLLAVAALIVFARRPGLHRKLHAAGARIAAILPRIPLPVHRPDLIVLSISRT